MMSQLTEYLTTLSRICNVQSVQVTIKGTVYEGASYDDGRTQGILYLLGERPNCYKRSTRTVFVINDVDYYIACYMEGAKITSQFAAYHPCGANFQLRRWSVPNGGAIDQYELTPYARVQASIA